MVGELLSNYALRDTHGIWSGYGATYQQPNKHQQKQAFETRL